MTNEALASALEGEKLEFSHDEWTAFEVHELAEDSYIKAGDKFLKPTAVPLPPPKSVDEKDNEDEGEKQKNAVDERKKGEEEKSDREEEEAKEEGRGGREVDTEAPVDAPAAEEKKEEKAEGKDAGQVAAEAPADAPAAEAKMEEVEEKKE